MPLRARIEARLFLAKVYGSVRPAPAKGPTYRAPPRKSCRVRATRARRGVPWACAMAARAHGPHAAMSRGRCRAELLDERPAVARVAIPGDLHPACRGR